MLSAELSSDLANFAQGKHELLEIHRCKISLHCAKEGYNHPTVRPPHLFSKLVGLGTQVYQTVHDGALAFLVVISRTGKASESPESPALT